MNQAYFDVTTGNGVFSTYTSSHVNGGGTGGGSYWKISANFNAARCSSIYGNSNTVQPRAYVVYYIIKVK